MNVMAFREHVSARRCVGHPLAPSFGNRERETPSNRASTDACAMAFWIKTVASFFGLIAAILSPAAAAVVVLVTAFTLRSIGRQGLVLGKLVPAYAAGRIFVYAIKVETGQDFR